MNEIKKTIEVDKLSVTGIVVNGVNTIELKYLIKNKKYIDKYFFSDKMIERFGLTKGDVKHYSKYYLKARINYAALNVLYSIEEVK